MWKKVAVGLLGLFLVGSLGLFLWVRSVLASDAVQIALARQLSSTIGQPVTIGGVSASIYPRITVALRDVGIGETSQISVKSLNVGTDLRALLSRKIEHATVRLDGATITLPLPSFTLGSDAPAEAPATPSATSANASSSPLEIVSIDSVMLSGIEIVNGERRLTGNIEVIPQGNGVIVKQVDLSAEDMSIAATGIITDLAGPVGEITLKAGALNLDRLIAFVNDFSSGLAGGAPGTALPASAARTPASVTAPDAMHLTLSIEAERATVGSLTIDRMLGRAVVKDAEVTVEPLTFGLFGGTYNGGLTVTLGTTEPTFHWQATVSAIDVGTATAYAGSPNTITGTLAGTVDLSGAGSDAATAMNTMAGTVRLDVTSGVVRNLGIVRSVGAATSLSVEGLKQASVSAANTDEAFTRIGATVAIVDGSASTQNLRFEAADLVLNASGIVRLDGSAINLKGQVELGEGLSQQVHHTMLKLSQENGRVILPALITGTLAAPIVKIDAGNIAKRALKNTATEMAPTLLKKGSAD